MESAFGNGAVILLMDEVTTKKERKDTNKL